MTQVYDYILWIINFYNGMQAIFSYICGIEIWAFDCNTGNTFWGSSFEKRCCQFFVRATIIPEVITKRLLHEATYAELAEWCVVISRTLAWTMLSLYNKVDFLPNIWNTHHIAAPWGQDKEETIVSSRPVFYNLGWFAICQPYNVMVHLVITRPSSIYIIAGSLCVWRHSDVTGMYLRLK